MNLGSVYMGASYRAGRVTWLDELLSQADRGSKLWKTYYIVGQFHFAFILCPED